MAGRPINASRADAVLMGDKTYIGSVHAKCGTTERYVLGGGCVHCARVIATEQRDARKFLRAQASKPLDIVEDNGLSEDERFAQSIEDDLM